MAIDYSRRSPKGTHGATPPISAVTYWSRIESIRAEWPMTLLDSAADLQKWREALALYERDDYPAMMQCAVLFSAALAHSLFGEGILHGEDLPETVRKTLYCSLCRPPDGRTFADSAQKAARLAMTIMRENGWQPPSLGGSRTWFEPVMMDTGNYFLLSAAIEPAGQSSASGDLKAFFAVPPTSFVESLPDPEVTRGYEMIHRLYDTIQDSRAGDAASKLYVDGMALSMRGDAAGALAKYGEAAKRGSVDAMASAGDLTHELGRIDESRFWYESAAKAGHPVGMFNMGIVAIQNGDHAAAVQWLQKAAEAGNVEGYAALTQLADDAGDESAERHWSRLGADAGHTFCIARYGLLLARDANGDGPTLRRARDLLEQAADRGNINSMGLAVSLNQQLGDTARGRRLVDMIVTSGNAEAIDRLRRYGLL